MLVQEFEKQGLSLFRWRSYWPLVGLALAVWIVWLRPNPYPELAWPALALGLLGLLVRIATVGYTPKNTSGRNTAEGQVAESINTQGMYSLVRHPLYLGNFDVAGSGTAYRPWLVYLGFYFGLLVVLRAHYVCRRTVFVRQVWC